MESSPTSNPSRTAGALPEEIVETVAIAGMNSVAMQSSALANVELANLVQNTNQAQQNEVSFQQTLDGVQATVLGAVVGMLTELGPLQAMSAQQILTGNSVSEEISALKAIVSTFPRRRRRGGGGTNDDAGPIPSGAPGSSALRPITEGALRLNPPAGVNMTVYVQSHLAGAAEPPRGEAPAYAVTSGDVYVYNGPGNVDISFGPHGDGVVAGNVAVVVGANGIT